MIAAISLIVMSVLFLTVRAFNASANKADRYRVTQEALNEAKAALIAYAVADANRPGSLPCPDVNNDGKSMPVDDYSGSSCSSLIGRLPWYTLGLPDLRDASGERLWYAVSGDFQANSTVPLNSDTAFRTGNVSLTIAGNQPAGNLVAIVFAPGTTLQRADGTSQSRPCPGAACNTASNFLDIAGTDNADANTSFISADESDTFNDRLIPIYSDDIMPLVEKRAAQEFATKLRAHFDAWKNSTTVASTKGFYPWAATFTDPSVASSGTSGTTAGLLPVNSSQLAWTSASSTVGSCSGVGTADLQCSGFLFCLFSACVLNMTGRIGNIGSRFVDPPPVSGAPPTAGTYSVSGLVIGGYSAGWTLNSAGQSLDFTLTSTPFLGIALVNFRAMAPASSNWLTTSWLTANNWHQVSYYGMSSRFAVNDTTSNNCALAPANQCLSVTNGVTVAANKEALVITAGRALPTLSPTAQTVPRPSGTASLANYMEGENLTPVDTTFQQGMRSSQFNDQVTVVRP